MFSAWHLLIVLFCLGVPISLVYYFSGPAPRTFWRIVSAIFLTYFVSSTIANLIFFAYGSTDVNLSLAISALLAVAALSLERWLARKGIEEATAQKETQAPQ